MTARGPSTVGWTNIVPRSGRDKHDTARSAVGYRGDARLVTDSVPQAILVLTWEGQTCALVRNKHAAEATWSSRDGYRPHVTKVIDMLGDLTSASVTRGWLAWHGTLKSPSARFAGPDTQARDQTSATGSAEVICTRAISARTTRVARAHVKSAASNLGFSLERESLGPGGASLHFRHSNDCLESR